MLKQDDYTKEEIVRILKSNLDYRPKSNPEKKKISEAQNSLLEHLIENFNSESLAFNTETGYFDYIGELLPQ